MRSLDFPAALSLLLLSGSASATEAWVSATQAHVRLRPSASSPVLGILERGDRVDMVEDVESQDGWTLLRPLGAVRSDVLVLQLPADYVQPAEYAYGRVIVPSTDVRARADMDAPVVTRQSRREVLAFKKPVDGEGPWLERPDGNFVARADIKLLVGSTFQGVLDPPPELAFLLRTVHLRSMEDPGGPDTVLNRYAAVAAESSGAKVHTAQGDIPRNAVRLARAVARPAGIGPETKWIHVNTSEQVLTAYEGDRMVFATLVSTGKRGWETPTGHFRVWFKLRHGAMRGHRERYLVEEVPNSLFFGGSTALHGVIWHERFGTPVSHGCVNLSPADAAWLFQWAPPELPEGWHGILPWSAGLESLWVIVENAKAPPATTKATLSSPTPGG